MKENCLDTLINVLDQVRAVAMTGLNFAENPYDREHYERLLQIASVNTADLTGDDPQELNERFRRETGYMTPKVGVNAAIFDDQKRILLLKRADNGKWGLPSGWVEVGEALKVAMVREIKEETGLDARLTYILDIYNSRAFAPCRPHNAIGILYLAERISGELKICHESTDIGYFEVASVTNWHIHHEEMAHDALEFINNPKPFSAIRIKKPVESY